MEESTKNLLVGVFFFILGISLFILSILDKRSYEDNENQSIKDNIDSINTCTYIIMGVSLFATLVGVIHIIRSNRPDFLQVLTTLSPRIESFIMIAFALLILIVGIIQRVKINNILPDMSDDSAVKSYNDHHTISASSVLGSNMAIIVSGIVLLGAGIVHFFKNREPEPQQEIIKSKAQQQHEKNMTIVASKKKLWEDALKSGKYSEDALEELELIYENARATAEKAYATYKKGIQDAKKEAENSQQELGTSSVKASLSTPVSLPQTTQKTQFNYPTMFGTK